MNHSPVYTHIGGHAYCTTYPSPIGKIILPQMMGLATKYLLPGASPLCGACDEVCPVKIPIPDLLIRLRQEATHEPRPSHARLLGQGAGKSTLASFTFKCFAFLRTASHLPAVRLDGYTFPLFNPCKSKPAGPTRVRRSNLH